MIPRLVVFRRSSRQSCFSFPRPTFTSPPASRALMLARVGISLPHLPLPGTSSVVGSDTSHSRRRFPSLRHCTSSQCISLGSPFHGAIELSLTTAAGDRIVVHGDSMTIELSVNLLSQKAFPIATRASNQTMQPLILKRVRPPNTSRHLAVCRQTIAITVPVPGCPGFGAYPGSV